MNTIPEEFALTDAEKQEELRLAANEVFNEGNPGKIQPFKVPKGQQSKTEGKPTNLEGRPKDLESCLAKLDAKEKEMKMMRNIIADYRNEEHFNKIKSEAEMKNKEKNTWYSFRKKKPATKSSKKDDVDLTLLPAISGLGLIATGAAVIKPSSEKGYVENLVGDIEEEVKDLKEEGVLVMLKKDDEPERTKPERTKYRYSMRGENTDDFKTNPIKPIKPKSNFWDFFKKKKHGGKRTRKGKRRKKKSRRRKKKTRKKRKKRKRRRTKKN